jgi:hypothetical protein
MVKDLPIKWNLMPEFFLYWDALKSVKYIPASPVNQGRDCQGCGERSGDVVHLEIFCININSLLALTPQ